MDWRGAWIVSLYKGNGDNCECCNLRGISVSSVVGKLYGRVYKKSQGSNGMCNSGEGCMDQVFDVRQVCERYLSNGKYVFWPFMDLKQAQDKIDRDGMCQVLRVYERKLLKVMQIVYGVYPGGNLYPEWPHRQGGCFACCGCTFQQRIVYVQKNFRGVKIFHLLFGAIHLLEYILLIMEQIA